MRYLLAFLLPPVAVLLCGKPFTAALNFLFTLLGYFPGLVHALFVVSSCKSDERHARQTRAIEAQTALIESRTRAQLEQAQQIAAAQLRTMVESTAVLAAGQTRLATPSSGPPPIPAPMVIEARYSVARNGEILGEYTWSEIQRYYAEGYMVASDQYFDGAAWVSLG